MLALAPATTAAAAPAGDPATISLADLGSSDTIYFDARRDTSSSTFSFAIQLAAAMATRYGWQKTDIAVVPIPGGVETMPAPGPRERQIVVRENPDKGLTLQPRPGTPALLITGPGPELTWPARRSPFRATAVRPGRSATSTT